VTKKAIRIMGDSLITLCLLLMATLLSALVHQMNGSDSNVISIYILSVLMISLSTQGYAYGMLASVLGVLVMNFLFTYPYLELNFWLEGYPITFMAAFLVSAVTSTLASKMKKSAALAVRQEHEAQELRRQAEGEKLRSNLLRGISHDLRTPLTSISGAAQTLLEHGDSLPESVRHEMLENVIDESQWLIHMVENLLSVTGLEEDPASLRKTEEAAEEVVAEAVEQVRKRYPGCCIAVVEPEELIFVPMDATLIEQVLVNLMENAVKYAGGRQGVEVRFWREDARACFQVRDHGAGLSEQALDRVFEGGGLHRDDADPRRGTGIGLSICHTIISIHGGRIWAENHPDGGAVFTFDLPMEEEDHD